MPGEGLWILLSFADKGQTRKQKAENRGASRPSGAARVLQNAENRNQNPERSPTQGGGRMQNAENRTPLREGERRGRKQNFRVERASRREVWELRRRKREKTEKTGGQ